MLAVILIVSVFALAGCNEKDKYAKAQTKVMQLLDKADAVKPKPTDIKTVGHNRVGDPNDIKTAEDDIANVKQQHEDIMGQINAKLDEMQGYAKEEPTLGPQLETFKKQVKERDTNWNGMIKEHEMVIESYKRPALVPDYDPYKGHTILP